MYLGAVALAVALVLRLRNRTLAASVFATVAVEGSP